MRFVFADFVSLADEFVPYARDYGLFSLKIVIFFKSLNIVFAGLHRSCARAFVVGCGARSARSVRFEESAGRRRLFVGLCRSRQLHRHRVRLFYFC